MRDFAQREISLRQGSGEPRVVCSRDSFFIGLLAPFAHFGMARALSLVEASSVIPLDFTRLPFAAAIGFAVFGELPDIWVWVGGIVIFTASVYLIHREAVAARAE